MFSRSFLIILFCSVLLYGQYAQQLTEEGMILYQQGRVDDAISLLHEAIAFDSACVDAHVLLGQIYLEREQPSRAEKLLRSALRFRMGHSEAHFALGVALSQQGQYREAIIHFKRVLVLNPDHPRTTALVSLSYQNMGVEAYQSGRNSEAIRYFSDAVKADPTNADAYSNLAAVFYETDQVDKARKALLRGLEIDPQNSAMLKMMIQLCHQQKDFLGAVKAAETAVKNDPGDIDLSLQLAYLYRFTNQSQKAIKLYQNLLKRYPAEKKIYDEFAHLYTARSQFDRAIELYEALAVKSSGEYSIYMDIARVYEQAKEYENARMVYRRAQQGDSQNIQLYHKIAKTYLEQKMPEKAVEVYLGAMEIVPNDWSLNRSLGLIYEDVEPEKAKNLYQRMALIRKNNPYPHIRLGLVWEELDSIDCAIEAYNSAVALGTKDPLPFHRLANWKLVSGDSSKAIKFERETVSLALCWISEKKGELLARLGASDGRMGLSQLQEMGVDAEKALAVKRTLRAGLINLLKLEEPEFLQMDLEEWLRKHPEETDLFEIQGQYYEREGSLHLAADAYRRLVVLEKENKAGHLGMARIFEKTGQDKEAILAYKRALVIDSQDRQVYESLIRLFQREGQIARLIDDWLLLVKIQPDNKLLLEYLSFLLQTEGKEKELEQIRTLLEEDFQQ